VKGLGPGLDGFSDDLVLDSVQNAIDETSGVLGSISLPEVNRFIDGDLRRNLFTVKELIEGHTEDRSVDHVDTIYSPILGILLDKSIQLCEVLQDAQDKTLQKIIGFSIGQKMFPKLSEGRDGVLMRNIQLIKNLEG
jgi:hypothetical protein